METRPVDARLPRKISLHAIYLAAAIAFSSAYFAATRDYICASLESLVAFTGRTPFQFRLLPLAIAHGITRIHPMPLRIVFGLMSIAATYWILLEYGKLLTLFIPARQARWLALFILYPMVWNLCLLNPYLYPSDVPAILLFVIGLRAMLVRRWMHYAIAFGLGLANRETICFLSVAFAIIEFGRMPKGRYVLSLFAQAAIWTGVKLALSWRFRNNPGSGDLYIPHARLNLEVIQYMAAPPIQILRIAAAFGGIWMLAPVGWRRQPIVARKLFWLVAPFFAGMWFVGNLLEMRVYGELIPVLATSAILGLRSRWIVPDESRPADLAVVSHTSAGAAWLGATLAMLILVATIFIDWRFPSSAELCETRIACWKSLDASALGISAGALLIAAAPTFWKRPGERAIAHL